MDEIHIQAEQTDDNPLLMTERQRQGRLIQEKRMRDSKRDAIVRKAAERHQREVDEATQMHPDVAFAREQVRDDSDPEAVRINRYGREERIESAAAAEELEAAAEREEQLRRRAEALARSYQDEPIQIDRDRLREAQEALLQGDDERSAELMAAAIEGARAQTRSEVWTRDEKLLINRLFNQHYSHLDDIAFADAQALMLQRISDPRNFGRTPGELVREVGDAVLAAHGQHRLESTSTRRLKAQVPVRMPPEFSVPPAPSPVARQLPSSSEYVQQLRNRSGSNSSRR